MRGLARDVLRFGVVGAVGFGVDASVLMALVWGGADALAARALSFPVAVVATWWLNRCWTFARADKARPFGQFNRYFAVQCAGGLANLAAYALALPLVPQGALGALAALGVGSFLGMFVNFLGARLFVFRP